MTKQKKPYVSPKVDFHPAGSPAYNRLHALLDEEMKTATEIPKSSYSASTDESFSTEICAEE